MEIAVQLLFSLIRLNLLNHNNFNFCSIRLFCSFFHVFRMGGEMLYPQHKNQAPVKLQSSPNQDPIELLSVIGIGIIWLVKYNFDIDFVSLFLNWLFHLSESIWLSRYSDSSKSLVFLPHKFIVCIHSMYCFLHSFYETNNFL